MSLSSAIITYKSNISGRSASLGSGRREAHVDHSRPPSWLRAESPAQSRDPAPHRVIGKEQLGWAGIFRIKGNLGGAMWYRDHSTGICTYYPHMVRQETQLVSFSLGVIITNESNITEISNICRLAVLKKRNSSARSHAAWHNSRNMAGKLGSL